MRPLTLAQLASLARSMDSPTKPDAVAVGVPDIPDPVKPSKLMRSTTSTSLPDSSIPLKKLIYALTAISLGTIIEWVRTVQYSMAAAETGAGGARCL